MVVAEQETEVAVAGPPVRKVNRFRDTRIGLMMVLPVLVMLGIFVIWPVVNAIRLSFYNWSFYKDPAFVGIRNYRFVLRDPLFLAAVGRGFKFVAMTVPVMLILGFLFANLVVAVARRLASTLKVTIYIPTIISSVIAALIFGLIYNYSGGLLNAGLAVFGVKPVAWIGDPKWALLAVAVPAIWLGLGLTSLIMVAALVDVPPEFYEAASVEGASWWQKTIFISLPQMKNVLLYLLVTGFVAALQQFEIPLVMTNGGPVGSTTTPNFYIFAQFRTNTNAGYPIAAALVIFVILGTVSAMIFRIVNSEKLVD